MDASCGGHPETPIGKGARDRGSAAAFVVNLDHDLLELRPIALRDAGEHVKLARSTSIFRRSTRWSPSSRRNEERVRSSHISVWGS
jgi:hypothetical protein